MAIPDATSTRPPRSVPTTGMRGGLGRMFLTAFLVLAIGPLSLVSWLAFDQVRNDQQQRVLDRLSVVADLTGAQLQDWAEERTLNLSLMANSSEIKQLAAELSADPASRLRPGQASIPEVYVRDFEFIWLHNTRTNGVWLVAGDSQTWQPQQGTALANQAPVGQPATLLADPGDRARFLITAPLAGPGQPPAFQLTGVARLPERFFSRRLLSSVDQVGRLYLADPAGRVFSLDGSPGATSSMSQTFAAGQADRDWRGLYVGRAGEPVLGVYHWLPDLNCALVAEQNQADAQATSDRFAAGLIAAALGVALLTAVIAAVVTRQMTRPIVHLTGVALRLAEGDLSQRVHTDRRDEIGILARVFNQMAADLGELYAGLEKKVAERTRELEEAKGQIQYHAWQLSISAEVGRVTTSILDLDMLLEKASQLIRDAFQLDHVGIYLLDQSGQIALLRKNAGRAVQAYERQLWLGGTHPVCWVITHRVLRLVARPGLAGAPACHELVLPLALGAKVVGALDLTNLDPAGFSESDQGVLQTLADQLTVAIENARAYGQEREVAGEMREIDRLRGQFLAHMSHQLATYLNTIIGFSQMMLKGLDGPLTELQAQDLGMIRYSGAQLAQLIDDILELASLEVGEIAIQPAPVNLYALLGGLRESLNSLVINPRLQIDVQAEPGLPSILADAGRLGQILTNLVSAAMAMSSEGAIRVRVAPLDDQVQFVVASGSRAANGAEKNRDVSLALSRRLVELHGGRLRVGQSAEGLTMFSFSLPTHTRPAPAPALTLPPGA